MGVSLILLGILATAGEFFNKESENTWDIMEKNPSSLVGKTVTIDGWIIPNETENGKITSFLLARYPGGCIHVPLPPPSSVVEVKTKSPINAVKSTQRYHINGIYKKGERVDAASVIEQAEVILSPP